MNTAFSTLELAMKQRTYRKSGGEMHQSERKYVDFVIDGQSLADQASRAGYDLVSILTREWPTSECEKSIRRLLLDEPADLPDDRRSLMVCAECGELGCGAISVAVFFSKTSAIWRDFGFENNYERKVHFDKLKSLGPFEFGLHDYRTKLSDAIRMMKNAR